MSFQSSVEFEQAFGTVGEFYTAAPSVVTNRYVLDSANPENNVFGRFFSIKPAENLLCEAGAPQATAENQVNYGGILVNPKSYANLGTSASSLAPTFKLPNGMTAALCSRGVLNVALVGQANVGDIVVFNRADGTLEAVSRTSAKLPENYFPIGAQVILYSKSAETSGIAVIDLNYTVPKLPPFTP